MFLHFIFVKKKELDELQIDPSNIPSHIGIIMDGNRRWARKNKIAIFGGHETGMKQIESIIDIASNIFVKMLTFYVFSTENWNREQKEIDYLKSLLESYLNDEYLDKLMKKNIKFIAIGNYERFGSFVQEKIVRISLKTKQNTGIVVCFAINYGGRSEIVYAFRQIINKIDGGSLKKEEITEDLITKNTYLGEYPFPDLIIRSGGDKRISNFLLWHISYSEFYFTDKMWPEFNSGEFLCAIKDYQLRDRRYGGK